MPSSACTEEFDAAAGAVLVAMEGVLHHAPEEIPNLLAKHDEGHHKAPLFPYTTLFRSGGNRHQRAGETHDRRTPAQPQRVLGAVRDPDGAQNSLGLSRC